MANTLTDKKKITEPNIGLVYNDALVNGGGSPTVQPAPVQQPTKQKSTFDLLRDQNFTDFQDSQIQLAAAKQNAMKATNAQLASQGLLGSGYGGLYANGIQSSYMNALQQASGNYQNANMQIAQDELAQQNQNASDSFQNLLAQMTELGSSQESLDKIMSSFGVTANNGALDFSKSTYGFTPEQQATLQNYYNSYSDELLQSALNNAAGDKTEITYKGIDYVKENGRWVRKTDENKKDEKKESSNGVINPGGAFGGWGLTMN